MMNYPSVMWKFHQISLSPHCCLHRVAVYSDKTLRNMFQTPTVNT